MQRPGRDDLGGKRQPARDRGGQPKRQSRHHHPGCNKADRQTGQGKGPGRRAQSGDGVAQASERHAR